MLGISFGVDASTNKGIPPPAFNPLDLSPLVLLDAQNPAGNGVIPPDSSFLSAWIDLSGNGNDFIAGISSPLYFHNQMNGNNVVSFDGLGMYLESPGIDYTSGTPISFFCISSSITGAGTTTIFCHGQVGDDGWEFSNTNISLYEYTRFGIASYQSVLTWSASYSSPSFLYDGATTMTFYKNGANPDAVTVSGPGTFNDIMTIGRYVGALIQFWKGNINFIFLKYGSLTSEQLAQMHAWANARLGI